MSQKPENTVAPTVPADIAALLEEARRKERLAAYGEARDLYARALRSLSDPDHASLAASLLRWIGDTHRDEGDTTAAWDSYIACRAVAELNDDGVNLAYVLNSLGILEWQWGRLEAAAALYGSAQRLAGRVGETRLQAMVAQNIGVLANIRGDLIGALRQYRRSLAAFRKLGDIRRMAGVLSNIGMLHTDLGQWEDAENQFADSARLAEQVGDLRSRVMIEVNRTELHILTGDFPRAMARCDVAFGLASRIGYHLGLGEVHKHYGMIYRRDGEQDAAEVNLRLAQEIAERFSNPLLQGEVQRELAQVYRVQERNQEALQALNAAHRIFSDLQARMELADVDERLTQLESIFLDVVHRWGESIESKDLYTAGHCQRVADYSCMLGASLGFDSRTLSWFRMGALLHDVGKTAVPAEILNKTGSLSDFEWEVMRRHPIVGVELLAEIEFPWDIRPMVRSHHERWDGRGYPDGLAAEEIPLAARILCVADVFDALTTTRPYRPAYTPAQALEIMMADAGQIFDPEPLRLFGELIRERISGSGREALGGDDPTSDGGRGEPDRAGTG